MAVVVIVAVAVEATIMVTFFVFLLMSRCMHVSFL